MSAPNYYTVLVPSAPNINGKVKVECWDIQEGLGMEKHHYISSAFAYLFRCLHKESIMSDLIKARAFIDREIENRKKAQ